ncbi:MAG: hypothetical protein WCO98_11795 [bacterium]
METKQKIGLIGSTILFISVFTPIISFPIFGNMNYFQHENGDGIIVLILSIVSVILILLKKIKWLWFTGLGSMSVIIYSFINFLIMISRLKTNMETDVTDDFFSGFTNIAVKSIQFQWGLPLLIIGAALIISSAAIKDASNTYQTIKEKSNEKESNIPIKKQYKVAKPFKFILSFTHLPKVKQGRIVITTMIILIVIFFLLYCFLDFAKK